MLKFQEISSLQAKLVNETNPGTEALGYVGLRLHHLLPTKNRSSVQMGRGGKCFMHTLQPLSSQSHLPVIPLSQFASFTW